MSVYFISDTHFGHKNVLKFRNRFRSVGDHDDYIVNNWNRTINKRDTVYHLGDFSFMVNQDAVNSYAKRLNGRIKLLAGNHDQVIPLTENVVVVHQGLFKYKEFWLSHCPIHNHELREKTNIHGHVHSYSIEIGGDNTTYNWMPDVNYFNVSCENINYQPIQLEKIRGIVNS